MRISRTVLAAWSSSFALLLIGVHAWASSLDERFTEANRLYREGKFDKAASAYQALVSGGIASSSLFYNLGNATVKTGEFAKAVLAYERSLRENPRDPEARANLEYTRGLLSDRVEDPGVLALVERFSPTQWLSWRENLWGFVLCYWAGALLGVVGIVLRRRWKGILVAAFVLLGVAIPLGAVLFLRSGLWAQPRAIVMAKEAEVRYGPVLGESTAFTLHEGSKVRVLRSAGDWVQILFAKGKVGWVPAEAIEKI